MVNEQAAPDFAEETPYEGPWEVLTDTWGYDPQHVRGDLLWRGDTPYDLDWAERVGSLRRAPEHARTGIASTTQPLTPSGEVDADLALKASGAVPPSNPAKDAASRDAILAKGVREPAGVAKNAPAETPPAPPEAKP